MSLDIYNPSEEHLMLRDLVASFTEREVEPQAAEADARGGLNLPLFRSLGELGLLGVTIPEAWGGAGMDATAAVIVHHELSRSDPGFALAYLAHAMLFVHNFFHAADEAQRRRVLPKVISGEWVGAMGMTEPGHGTDVLGMRTTATRRGDVYLLNGAKTYITNAVEAQVFLVYAKVEGRITSFLVDRETPGFSVGGPIDKVGMRASSMAELFFEDAVVPVGDRLGEDGQGLVHMMRNLEIERLTLAAISLGIADRCLDVMVRHGQERQAFGRPIQDFGQIQRYIAESYAETEAARALIYAVAQRVAVDRRNRLGSDAAKLFAGPVGKRAADNAMQVLGGSGYCREYPVERLWRDAKLLEIGGGTLESHQKNITRELSRERPL
ncbi:MAG: acyl-CoA dehydrogenase family protein [Deltaproteobacteria bacterium]|nr:acyl-CoA dehydrogenase family protein [Deltaproteobacteria bacterium]